MPVMKFKHVPMGAKFISELYLHICEKYSDKGATTEYGNTLFDAEDEVLCHGTVDGMPAKPETPTPVKYVAKVKIVEPVEMSFADKLRALHSGLVFVNKDSLGKLLSLDIIARLNKVINELYSLYEKAKADELNGEGIVYSYINTLNSIADNLGYIYNDTTDIIADDKVLIWRAYDGEHRHAPELQPFLIIIDKLNRVVSEYK